MNGQTRDPELPDDDDIPTLTEIVVPGRLRAEPPADEGAGQAPSEFVFDIDFASPGARRDQPYDAGVETPAAAIVDEPAFELPADASATVQEAELPLPWAAGSEPAQVGTETASPVSDTADLEPMTAAPAVPAGGVEPSDPAAQALLREALTEIGDSLERRLQDELALTEQRLRAVLREELDRRLHKLLAGTPPTV